MFNPLCYGEPSPSNNAKTTRSASVRPGERNSSTTFTSNTRAIFSISSSTNVPTSTLYGFTTALSSSHARKWVCSR
jgi:hypothetical protein